MARRETWPHWAIGVGFGAVVGLPVASFGPRALVTAVAMVALATVAVRNLALLSGAITGIGAMWLAMLIRAHVECEAYDAMPNRGCEGYSVEPWAIAAAVVLTLGLLLGGLAWRRRAHEGDGA